MCGIAGIWGGCAPDAASSIAGRMADRLLHRGPDDHGVWCHATEPLALSHRRLAILDLSTAGHQPMKSRCGRYVLVFNGEIYNHLQLREQLVNNSWRGESDTETLLQAIVEMGFEAALLALNGMFALAVWDSETQAIYLARDRLGEKPLYYGSVGDSFVFASEPKAFGVLPEWQGEIDRDALGLYFRHQYVPAPHSIYQGIKKLRPGHYAVVQNGQAEQTCYWDLANLACASEGLDCHEVQDELNALLIDSVSLRLLADVPLGAFLSGGYDSSLVAALMTQVAADPVKTFTIGFQQNGFNEAPHAMAVAAHLGTAHTELYVSDQDALDVIPKIAQVWCEPFADSSQIPAYLVSALARQHVTVCLSGDGGDELFHGYPRYLKAGRWWSRLSQLPAPLREMMQSIWLPKRLDRGRGLLHTEPALFYREFVSHWKNPEALVRWSQEPEYFFSSKPNLPNDFDLSMGLIDALTYLPDDLLVKVDRASMAHGLEARVPLLDHRLVEFAMKLPASMKTDGVSGKLALKEIAHRYVPEHLLNRPKMGFGVPLGEWLRGPLRDWAETLIQNLDSHDFLDADQVRGLWQAHVKGEQEAHYLLWDVLMFQLWWQEGRAV